MKPQVFQLSLRSKVLFCRNNIPTKVFKEAETQEFLGEFEGKDLAAAIILTVNCYFFENASTFEYCLLIWMELKPSGSHVIDQLAARWVQTVSDQNIFQACPFWRSLLSQNIGIVHDSFWVWFNKRLAVGNLKDYVHIKNNSLALKKREILST